MLTLDDLRDVFERSPWVAERAWRKQPFASIDALHGEMMGVVRAASREQQLALVRAHPELAGGTDLTADSSSEQGRLGFTRLSQQEFQRMQKINALYREKFGFPCIVALRLHADRAGVMKEMEHRLGNNAQTELANALEQIGHITRGRLEKLWGKLTTHVLDTANGKPGAGVRIVLSVLEDKGWKKLKTVTTNKDGRTDEPLAEGLKPGQYRLQFHLGDYFGKKDFLDVVPVRFNVADAGAHYHVPLLCSPWGYTTYRGS